MSFIRFISLSLLSVVFISCVSGPKDIPANLEFKKTTDQFVQDYWKAFPEDAAEMSMVEAFATFEMPTEERRKIQVAFAKKYQKIFEAFKDEELSFSQRTDKSMVLNEMKKAIWEIQTFKEFQWNPALYNPGRFFSYILSSTRINKAEKLKYFKEHLLKGKEFYQLARKNLNQPTKPHVQHAIKQSKGLIRFLNGELRKRMKEVDVSRREKNTVYQRIDVFVSQVRSYRIYLESLLKNPEKVGGFRDFRISEKLYQQKFDLETQPKYSPEELYKKALSAKQDARSKMFEASILLYPKYFGTKLPPKDREVVVKSIMAKVVKQHTTAKNFVGDIRKQIPELSKFVNEKQLLTLDPTRPLKVKEMPAYTQGFAGAYLVSPGPFDPLRETYYEVSPLDRMSRKQQESYLREYNDYTLQILNIHEAIPGHYVQLLYSNKAASPIKSLFRNKAMVEGWAVYAERMMMEAGYGKETPELELMYYKWFLRVVTNTILDYEIHHKGLTKKQAMDLMVKDAYQEKAEAEGKWHRATVSQVQLTHYFSGFTEIMDLRAERKAKLEEEFKLKSFNEKLLSFGSAPVKEIKKLIH